MIHSDWFCIQIKSGTQLWTWGHYYVSLWFLYFHIFGSVIFLFCNEHAVYSFHLNWNWTPIFFSRWFVNLSGLFVPFKWCPRLCPLRFRKVPEDRVRGMQNKYRVVRECWSTTRCWMPIAGKFGTNFHIHSDRCVMLIVFTRLIVFMFKICYGWILIRPHVHVRILFTFMIKIWPVSIPSVLSWRHAFHTDVLNRSSFGNPQGSVCPKGWAEPVTLTDGKSH